MNEKATQSLLSIANHIITEHPALAATIHELSGNISGVRAHTTTLNLLAVFPAFRPASAGTYKDSSSLTIEAINSTFPLLASVVQQFSAKPVTLENIEDFSLDAANNISAKNLKRLFDTYGSDKSNNHNYHHIYGAILNNPTSVTNILEIGLGTNNIDVVSSMGPSGKPGASVRAFRDYCPNAAIFGADIDERILFHEERINTFYVDQTKKNTLLDLRSKLPNSFDLVIDDGLHSPHANIQTLEFALGMLKKGGWFVVEDIGIDALDIWKVVSSVLSSEFEPHIYSAEGAIVFGVKRL